MKQAEFYGLEVATSRAIWAYNFKLNKNLFVHWLYVICFHFTTALVLDGAALLIGKKPQ